jgi:hypothetical protein
MADFTGFVLDAPPPINGIDFPTGFTLSYAAPVEYAQRVWSTGGSVWCYYIGAVNATPASTATTPNWITSAIRHQVLGVV